QRQLTHPVLCSPPRTPPHTPRSYMSIQPERDGVASAWRKPMKWTLCPVGSLLLAIAPMIAQGADLPVSYLVNLNALRASAPAGTPLTFALYIDDACTTEVASQVVNVENVNVI